MLAVNQLLKNPPINGKQCSQDCRRIL